jgi:predicted ATP-binding protein involved in virulence
MPADKKSLHDAMYYQSLSLENVRAFGSQQSLTFLDKDNKISLWNLILGENGVGKTTLMQALAVMWPVPGYEKPQDTSPTLSAPELSESEDNDDIIHFIRRAGSGDGTMMATLQTEDGTAVTVGATIMGDLKLADPLKDVKWTTGPYIQRGPLVIGYGAARHVGHGNLAIVKERKATKSLFSDAIDLYDAEEIFEGLHYRSISRIAERDRDEQLLKKLKAAAALLLPELPDLTAAEIVIEGPRSKGIDQSGVLVHTPSGVTPLLDLSLGYQTMFALTVDLAWRLFEAFPDSAEPLSESAIVLIDEVDLHLHPQWQRSLRKHLLDCFPKVQFIVTTHSPITAQETLSEGGNVAVVRWVDGEAHILDNPVPEGEWRSDQLLESELFEFGADRSLSTEEKLYERVALSRTTKRTAEQEARLRELDEFVASLPTAPSPRAQSFEDLMMRLAKDYPKGIPQ